MRWYCPTTCKLLASLTAVGFACYSSAQTPISLQGFKIEKPPVIDGTVDEAAEWKDVPSIQGLYDGQDGKRSSDDGKFWLAYDNEYIYFAAKLHDTRPETIRATHYETNVDLVGDDAIDLSLDVTGLQREWATFSINPKGATTLRLPGGRAAKREWMGEFLAKARITSDGWECEARIPWKILSLPAPGARDMRFQLGRYMPRLQRFYGIEYHEGSHPELLPYWRAVVVPRSNRTQTLKLLPFAYGGYDRKTGYIANSGLDFKTTFGEGVTVVGTVNPDFRNIENSILSLGFSRYERLADETRPFFQEGANYMPFGIFASQRIRNFDAGLNMYGKATDRASFSFLDTADFGKENATVANVLVKTDQRTSFAVGTALLSEPGVHNEAAKFSLSRSLGNYYVSASGSQTDDNSIGKGHQFSASGSYYRKGLNAYMNVSETSRKYRPRLGYVPAVDTKGISGGINNYFQPNRGSFLNYYYGIGFGKSWHLDDTPFTSRISGNLGMTLRNGLSLSYFGDASTFEQDKDFSHSFSVAYPQSDPYHYFSLSYGWGRAANTMFKDISLNAVYRVTRDLQFDISHQIYVFGGYDDQTIFSGSYDFHHNRSLSMRVVRHSGQINPYLAFRQSGNRGTEYYMIVGDPNASTFHPALVLKVVVPVEIKLGKR